LTRRPTTEAVAYVVALVAVGMLLAGSGGFAAGAGEPARGALLIGLALLLALGFLLGNVSPLGNWYPTRWSQRTYATIGLAQAVVVGVLVGAGAQAQPISGQRYHFAQAVQHGTVPGLVAATLWLVLFAGWGRWVVAHAMLALDGSPGGPTPSLTTPGGAACFDGSVRGTSSVTRDSRSASRRRRRHHARRADSPPYRPPTAGIARATASDPSRNMSPRCWNSPNRSWTVSVDSGRSTLWRTAAAVVGASVQAR
jgi:hypothetical protein